MINSLQVFLGFAALVGVLHHSALSTDAFVGGIPPWLAAVLLFRYLGVDFFFVLSGIIVMRDAHRRCH